MATAPSNIKAEREILGAVLLSEQHFWEGPEELEPDAFLNEDHRAVFQVMVNLAHANRQITQSAIMTRCQSLPSGESIIALLSALQHEAKKQQEERGLFIAENAADLAWLHTRRQIMKLTEEIGKKAEKGDAKPDEVLELLIANASDLVRSSDRVQERTLKDIGQETLRYISDAMKSPVGIHTGLKTLDDHVAPFIDGDVVLLGGSPGAYKTALATQIALHVSKMKGEAQGDSAGFYQLEMENKAIMMRAIAAETGIPARQLVSGVKSGQFETITDAVQSLGKHNLTMIANRDLTIGMITAHMRAMTRRYGTKLFVIDHLGLIERGGRYQLKKFEKDFENAKDIMKVTKALGVTTIILCHLTKTGRQKETPEPEMEDFSGGGIEQHADIMLCNLNRFEWLDKHRPPNMDGKAGEKWLEQRRTSENRIEVYWLKHRMGKGYGHVNLHCDYVRTRFSDVIDDSAQQELIMAEGNHL